MRELIIPLIAATILLGTVSSCTEDVSDFTPTSEREPFSNAYVTNHYLTDLGGERDTLLVFMNINNKPYIRRSVVSVNKDRNVLFEVNEALTDTFEAYFNGESIECRLGNTYTNNDRYMLVNNQAYRKILDRYPPFHRSTDPNVREFETDGLTFRFQNSTLTVMKNQVTVLEGYLTHPPFGTSVLHSSGDQYYVTKFDESENCGYVIYKYVGNEFVNMNKILSGKK